MDFFQNLTFDDPLLNMLAVSVAGIVGGELFVKMKLPKVTGCIVSGMFEE